MTNNTNLSEVGATRRRSDLMIRRVFVFMWIILGLAWLLVPILGFVGLLSLNATLIALCLVALCVLLTMVVLAIAPRYPAGLG